MWRFEAVPILMLCISTIYGEFQVHFEEREYTFPESSQVCVIVRLVEGPAAVPFSISYTFDAVLIGGPAPLVHTATLFFEKGATSSELCLDEGGGRDTQVCESDTKGMIQLINSSAIRVVEPYITSITITDVVFASFSQSSYTLQEGTSMQHLTLSINSALAKSITFSLTPEPLLNATSPLSLLTTELHYESLSTSASIAVELRDNDIALEVPEVVSLGITLSSSQCYDLTITATEIIVLDNDMVTLRFMEEMVSVKESEGEARVCVSISHIIARSLNFVIIHNSVMSENQQKGGSVFGQFPRLSNINERCFTIPFLDDNIVGNDRQFIARLDVDENSFPPDVVTLINPTVTVHIQDTSICYDIDIDNSTDQTIEVPSHHSICFICHFKQDKGMSSGTISWKIGGLVVQSGLGEVLADGTLQVTNSSSVFHDNILALVSCSSREDGEEFTFPVLLQGGDALEPTADKSSKSSAHTLHSTAITLTTLLCTITLIQMHRIIFH